MQTDAISRELRMDDEPSSQPGFWPRLLHRWFVEYNPSYVLSAVLVLVGLTLMSRGLVDDPSVWGQLGVGALSEAYSIALIFGAALLMRIGLRRPAVFVALIAVLYQGDLALGTESYALLARVGQLATVVWLMVFVAKSYLLAWALRLRLSSSAIAVPSLGALGLAMIPQVSRAIESRALTMVVAAWLLALFAAALWTSRSVKSEAELDPWGRTVLRRSMRATWTIWACMVVGHVIFWTSSYNLHRGVIIPVVLLLSTRWIRPEIAVIAVVSTTLTFAFAFVPEFFQLTALMSALVLSLHALRKPNQPQTDDAPPRRDQYRAAHSELEPTRPELEFARSPPEALARQLAWAGYGVYLAAWTVSWSGGAWPVHAIALDLSLSAAVALFVWRIRHRIIALPLMATYVHWSIQSRLVRAPQSMLMWGVATVAVGFGLLLSSLLASWRIQKSRPLAH